VAEENPYLSNPRWVVAEQVTDEAWCRAASAHAKATRLAEWHATDAALLVLGEARLSAAMAAGLLTRTYFRNSADAVTRPRTG
jgi:hypothetical protein